MLFAPGGKYVRSEPVDRRQLWGLANVMRVGWYAPALPDHSLLEFVRTEEPIHVPEGESGPTESHPNSLLVRVSADLLTVDTLGLYRLRQTYFVELPGGAIEFVTHPFFDRGHLAISTAPTMIHLSGGAEYSVRRFSQDGALDMIIRRTLPRRTPTMEEREAAWSEFVRDVEPERFRGYHATLPFPTPPPTFLEWRLDPAANSGCSESRSFGARARRFLTSSILRDCTSEKYDWTLLSESGRSAWTTFSEIVLMNSMCRSSSCTRFSEGEALPRLELNHFSTSTPSIIST